MSLVYISLDTPYGRLLLGGDEAGIHSLSLANPDQEIQTLTEGPEFFSSGAMKANAGPLFQARKELEEYFAGSRREFTVPLAPAGTEFQLAVWTAMQEIPYGEVRSYAELARSLGRPTATRAVGGACGRNPIGIIIPCHRVIRTDGTLGGFGGGIQRKEWLLKHEGYL